MDPYLRDALDVLLRMLHVTAGIAWIGASFYFVRLDLGLRAPKRAEDAEAGVAGEFWGVHGGGLYHSQKYRLAPAAMPDVVEELLYDRIAAALAPGGIVCLSFVTAPAGAGADKLKTFLDEHGHPKEEADFQRLFATDGTFLGSWGSLGSGADKLDSPWGITVDDEGYVYVADHKNHRVQKFTSDGDFVAQIGGPGTKRASLSYPTDVAVDPAGDVYICTWNTNAWDRGRIQIFDAEGRFLTGLVGDAQQLSTWAEMTVAANTDYLKRRREVRSTEPEWTFAQPTAVAFGMLTRFQTPSIASRPPSLKCDTGRLLVNRCGTARVQIPRSREEESCSFQAGNCRKLTKGRHTHSNARAPSNRSRSTPAGAARRPRHRSRCLVA